ncbi:MAG TPA: Hsp20/alpha crystallin family protein [Nevskiaceae bacterium]|nr:Hsp20/alpha crystallin family protein [Nevskiaceae bacterium]
MQVVQWNPFREMEDMLARFGGSRALAKSGPLADWAPAVDIKETDKEYSVKAELPGVGKDDVKVDVQNGVLTLSGERKFEKEDKDAKHHRIERAYGSFTRSFVLPEDVLADKISAEHKDGVLCVHLPKTDIRKDKSTQIKIQ